MNSEYADTKASKIDSMMSNLREVSIPRLVGSDGERKTQAWLKDKISAEGFEVKTEPVPTSLFRINFLQGLSAFAATVLCILSAYLFSLNPFLFIIPIVLIFIILSMVSSGSTFMAQAPNVPWPWKNNIIMTENIYAEIVSDKKSQNEENTTEIIFMGHYDSKSNVLTGAMRVFLYLILLLCAVSIVICGITGIIVNFTSPEKLEIISKIMNFLAIISIPCGFLLTINVVGNKSIGVADNGTAVVILLDLMKHFKENPLENVNMTFLFSAAEEIGLTGAYNFLKNRLGQPRWDPSRCFIINYDLAGLKGPFIFNDMIGIPKKTVSPKMTEWIDIISKEQNFPVKKAYLPIGAWTDANPFIEKGYETATFAGISTKIHSKGDNFDIIDEENLFKAYVMGIELAKKINER